MNNSHYSKLNAPFVYEINKFVEAFKKKKKTLIVNKMVLLFFLRWYTLFYLNPFTIGRGVHQKNLTYATHVESSVFFLTISKVVECWKLQGNTGWVKVGEKKIRSFINAYRRQQSVRSKLSPLRPSVRQSISYKAKLKKTDRP